MKRLDESSAWLEIAEGKTIRFDRRALAMKQVDMAAADAAAAGSPAHDAPVDDAPGANPGSHQNGQ